MKDKFFNGNSLSDKAFNGNTHLKQDNFCLDYAESLAEGDLRPILIENYEKEDEE